MGQTYYDSTLTDEQIQAALDAIDGLIVPANNGKALAVSGGKLVARSVTWGGSSPVLEPLSVTDNGDYAPGAGVDGFSSVHVAVPASQPNLQAKTATQNGVVTPDTGYDGLSSVTVNVSGGGEISLPTGYTRAEYIRSDGAGGINTGVTANQDTVILLDFKVTARKYWTGIAGIIEGSDERLGLVWFGETAEGNNRNTARIFYDSQVSTNEVVTSSPVASDATRCRIGRVSALGANSKTFDAATFQTTSNIYLFGMNNMPSGEIGWTSTAGVIIYRCKIYQGETLVADLIPCTDPNNAIGMYDIVRETFCGLVGANVLSAGYHYEWAD